MFFQSTFGYLLDCLIAEGKCSLNKALLQFRVNVQRLLCQDLVQKCASLENFPLPYTQVSTTKLMVYKLPKSGKKLFVIIPHFVSAK